MSWEALRLTSRTPSEIYHTIGPNGVDGLIRKVLATCWETLPAEGRGMATWEEHARRVIERNFAVWEQIKQPTPENFFKDLGAEPADGFMRQAMVLCWMMMPRGHKQLDVVLAAIRHIVARNIAAWEEDNVTFTRGPAKKPAARKLAARKPAKAAGKVKRGRRAKRK